MESLVVSQVTGLEHLRDDHVAPVVKQFQLEAAVIVLGQGVIAHQEKLDFGQAIAAGSKGLLQALRATRGRRGNVQASLKDVVGHQRAAEVRQLTDTRSIGRQDETYRERGDSYQDYCVPVKRRTRIDRQMARLRLGMLGNTMRPLHKARL